MNAWESFLKQLDGHLGKASVDTWLRILKIVDFDAANLTLDAPDAFQLEWFKEHVTPFLKEFVNNNNRPIKIHFKSQASLPSKPKENVSPSFQPTPLDPEQTFESFTYKKDKSFARNFFFNLSLGDYNPLYLYGLPGVGKTHLLNATALKLKSAGLNVFFVHAQTFTQHVVSAIRGSSMRALRTVYRHPDVLIIDDIHCLERKMATQEELFHTFNALHMAGKQIILSSHLSPSRLKEIESRLVSRFEWGIVLDLPKPDQKQLKEILSQKGRHLNFSLSEETIGFLVEAFSSSVKATMRAFEALALRARTPPSTQQAKVLLADLLDEEKNQLSPEKIIADVAHYFDIRHEDILGKSQTKEFSLPRHISMYLCRRHLALSYKKIGYLFGRDHSTVMTSIRHVEKKYTEKAGEIAGAVRELLHDT